MNDINVLNCSTIMEKILICKMVPAFSHTVNNHTRKLCYYLVDAIYPKWAIFLSTISDALFQKGKQFCSAHDGIWKEVQPAFVVLSSRWDILRYPCLFCDREVMCTTMKACIILHNMIVEAQRDGYRSEPFDQVKEAIESGMFIGENGNEKQFGWRTREACATPQGQVPSDTKWVRKLGVREMKITDEVSHFALKNDLVEHIWCTWGLRQSY